MLYIGDEDDIREVEDEAHNSKDESQDEDSCSDSLL